MTLTRYKLGDLIVENTHRNTLGELSLDYVRGITKDKAIRKTSKADVDEATARKFYIVDPGAFVYNPRTDRMGGVCATALNDTNEPLLFSFNNVAFDIRYDAQNIIDARYLYMFFNRSEFDRYVRFHSWGSATQLFTIEDMKSILIDLPPIDIQRRYAEAYEAYLENQRHHEQGIDDLKLACDLYIEHLLHTVEKKPIRPFIELFDARNKGKYGKQAVRGISTDKALIPTKANLDGVSLDNYKIVDPGMIAYVADTSRRGDKISIAMNDASETYLVSSISIVFRTLDGLDPNYLMLYFSRSEFDRYARFNSWGSAREAFNWEDMQDVCIPIPDIDTQRAIADLFIAYVERKRTSEKLAGLLKNICPVLIKGSIDEARKWSV